MTTVAEGLGVITERDLKALKTAEELITYHGKRYISCDAHTSMIVCKWHEKLSGAEVEYKIHCYGRVDNYSKDAVYGSTFSACGHGVNVTNDWSVLSAAIPFIAMLRVGDTVSMTWIRSTNDHKDSEGTPYQGMQHDRCVLVIERKGKRFAFPFSDAVSFGNPQYRMIVKDLV